MPGPLWQPSAERVATTGVKHFMAAVERRWGTSCPDYARLHAFSVAEPEKFWISVWDFAGIIAERRGERVLVDGRRMPGARFFPDARLNFAENLLRRRDDGDAIVFWGEGGGIRRRLSWRELYDQVSLWAQALGAAGVGPGDRVVGYLPNLPETAIAMLATAAIGAVWSSCSPDFGVGGVVDRFGQIGPRVLVAADGYRYNGKTFSILDKLPDILAELPTVERTIVVPYVSESPPVGTVPRAALAGEFLSSFQPADIEFVRQGFNEPLFILFSSGTTGAPKCIVHGQGGTLIKHLEEHQLQCDVRAGDRVFFFTTCGWMMWNWLVSALASEATILLYEGSPFHPDGRVLFDLAASERATLFGAGAKFYDAVKKAGLRPAETHDFAPLRTVCSTGSPLAPESFQFIYDAIRRDMHLASISGGTDIIGCFVLGDPTGPVHAGEIQAAALGLRVEVFDDDGRATERGKGQLVCTNAFPSMPVCFWNDPDDERYRAAYFEVYPNVWHHGDYIERTEHGGFIMHGRSDATLNPGGVRIGTAEIYGPVEQLDAVTEALVVGQDWKNDVRVVLFVKLEDGAVLDDELRDRIRAEIRRQCTPRHLPARIIQVADIPRTKSGKITELAVRDTIHGRPVKNTEALANPEALELYRDLPDLQTD